MHIVHTLCTRARPCKGATLMHGNLDSIITEPDPRHPLQVDLSRCVNRVAQCMSQAVCQHRRRRTSHWRTWTCTHGRRSTCHELCCIVIHIPEHRFKTEHPIHWTARVRARESQQSCQPMRVRYCEVVITREGCDSGIGQGHLWGSCLCARLYSHFEILHRVYAWCQMSPHVACRRLDKCHAT